MKRGRKNIRIARHPKENAGHKEGQVSKQLRETLLRFQEYHPPRRFSNNLRTMLLEFLMYDGSVEALYLRELLFDLEGLFELLEVLDEDAKKIVLPSSSK